ncbi:MAG: PQQ-binding-like beta-propeller repeat protein [Gemmataceae bacterium]
MTSLCRSIGWLVLGTGLLVFLCFSAQGGEKGNADWPVFRGNTLQTGVANSGLPEKLEVLWKFETKDAIEATAAIVGQTAYVGCTDELLYALDLASGKEKWKYKGAAFMAPASVRNGRVYIGDSDGTFHCVDAQTGKKIWTLSTDAEIKSGASFFDNKVLFGAYDSTLYCLDKDGKEVWKFRAQGPINGSATIVDGRTFAAGCDSSLHVIDSKKGTEILAVDLEGQAAATAAVVGDYAYVGTMTNQVLAVDWKKGEVKWTFQAQKKPQAFYGSAAATDKFVVIGSQDKRVYGLHRDTGKEAWSYLTRGKVDSSPVVVGQRVFVGSADGKLYDLDLGKGTKNQEFNLDGPITASPAVGGGCLVIGTQKNTIYCLGSKKAGRGSENANR